ncbi:MAG: DHH family phosphoesterase [Mogibacterium sp.]|nr:DHH family phosphoesterase [Mogibacterium sp.]
MDTNFINQIPLPTCVVDTEGLVLCANPLIKNVFVYEDIAGSNFFTLTGVKRESLLKANEEEIIIFRNDRLFKIRTNNDVDPEKEITVLFDEATARESFRSQLENDRAVIIFINIDNYEDLIANSGEDNKRVIPSQIDVLLRKWADHYDSPVMTTDDDKYIMFTTRGRLEKMGKANFSILDEVRKIESTKGFPASISIGAGVSDISMLEAKDLAQAALELAVGRGGDQAVVKNDEGTKYYGGTLQAIEKSNRGKSRVIAHAMKAMIKDADKVLIMGHKWPDMDAFGSAIGAYCICKYLGKDAYIVIDKHNEALDSIYNQAEDTGDYNIIKQERALKGVTPKTLLIIVDTNRPKLVECPELVTACSTRIIIDHHRITEDSFKNASIAYIESYASSASELMAELLQHFAQKRFINKFEAEAMLAGIMVDTNNFSGRTGVRTFEAASWLKRAGADTVEVKRFFQMNKGEFKIKASAIAGADFTDYGAAFAMPEGNTGNTVIINAQVADELLMVKGVRASFAVSSNEKGQTIISARSLGAVNVQSMMEKFGGGGHLTSAAAQVDDDIENVVQQLRKLVSEIMAPPAE